MLRKLIRDRKAASVAEFATLSSLVFTLGLVLYIGLNGRGGGFYQDTNRDMDILGDRITENCLVRTRANDTVLPRQAVPFNCFKLDHGNDRISVDKGDNIIYPGEGRDVVIIKPGTRDTQIVYQGGDDVYHFIGGRSLLDLRSWRKSEVLFDIGRKSPSSILPGARFDPDNRPANDLHIELPNGVIIIADHFDNQPVDSIAFSDIRLSGEAITVAAIQDQMTDRNDQILGTRALDLVAPGDGDDKAELFEGDDIVTYTRGHDRYDAGPGQDVLEIPGVRSRDVDFAIQEGGDDISIVVPGKGSILLIDQAKYPPASPRTQFAILQFEDEMMRSSTILTRAVLDQATPADDRIIGSRFSDTIRAGSGKNEIYPDAGSDIIIHSDGNDTIYPSSDETSATDILDLSQFSRRDLTFERTDEGDLVITTPTGSTVTIKRQFEQPPGVGSNIEVFRLKGEELPDSILRQLYFQPVSDD